MFCTKCGQQLGQADTFCRNCGIKNVSKESNTPLWNSVKPEENDIKIKWTWKPRIWWISLIIFWFVGASLASIISRTTKSIQNYSSFLILLMIIFVIWCETKERKWGILKRVLFVFGMWILESLLVLPALIIFGFTEGGKIGNLIACLVVVLIAMRRSTFFVKPIEIYDLDNGIKYQDPLFNEKGVSYTVNENNETKKVISKRKTSWILSIIMLFVLISAVPYGYKYYSKQKELNVLSEKIDKLGTELSKMEIDLVSLREKRNQVWEKNQNENPLYFISSSYEPSYEEKIYSRAVEEFYNKLQIYNKYVSSYNTEVNEKKAKDYYTPQYGY